MRIIVSADTHLGSPIRSIAMRNAALGDRLQQASRDTFKRIIDLAIAEQADALILAGDIFDNDFPDLRSRAFLVTQLLRAGAAGVPTILIRGNHDALLDHQAHGDLGPNIHLLHKDQPSVQIGGAFFHGLSFETSHVKDSMLPQYPAPVAGHSNIGLMHTSLDGSPSHDPYAPCAIHDLMTHGYDVWCLGHIHMPFVREAGNTLAVMPGIPQPRHYGERFGGSVSLVTIDDNGPRHEYRDVGQLRFVETDIDLTGCADQSEVVTTINAALREAQHPTQDTAIRLVIKTAFHTSDDLEALAAEILQAVDRVYIDKIKLSLPTSSANENTDDLIRLMRDVADDDGFQQASAQVILDICAALPAEIRDSVSLDMRDTLVEDALIEVSLTLQDMDKQ